MLRRTLARTPSRTLAPILLAALAAGCASSDPGPEPAAPSNNAAPAQVPTADGAPSGGAVSGGTVRATGTGGTATEPLAGLWNLSQQSGGQLFESYLQLDADGAVALYAADSNNNCFVVARGTLTAREDDAFALSVSGPGGVSDSVVGLELQGPDSLVVVNTADGSRMVAPRVVEFTVQQLEGTVCSGSAATPPTPPAGQEPAADSRGTWTDALANVTVVELSSGSGSFTSVCTLFDPSGRFRQNYKFSVTGSGVQRSEHFGSWTATGGYPNERGTVSLAFDDGDSRLMVMEIRGDTLVVDGSPAAVGGCGS